MPLRRKNRKKIFLLALLIFIFGIIAVSYNYFPTIFLPILNKGDLISPKGSISTVSDFTRELSKNNIATKEVKELPDSRIVGILEDGITVYFAPDKEAGWQVLSLKAIISRFSLEGKKPKIIDFRFKNPIVKF
jgi:hypothetical protein